MKPNEVSPENEQQLLNTVYNYKRVYSTRRKAKFKVGEYVRLSNRRATFDKGYKPNWSTAIFEIRKVQYNTDPITYLIKDSLYDEEIEGGVYAEELQHVKYPGEYLVEKVLRRKNGMVFVKYLGFSDEHNSWIPESELDN